MELRFLALYPEQMNIYADRGNVALPAAALRVARHRLRPRQRRPRRGVRPRRARLHLPRRRPGPRPARGRRRHGREQARGDGRGDRGRRRRARRLRRLPAARQQLPARAGEPAGPGPGRAGDGSQPGAALDRQRRDRGRSGRRPADRGRLREPRRPHPPRRRGDAAGQGARRGSATTARTASRACATRT